MVCKVLLASLLYLGHLNTKAPVHSFYVSITYLKVEGQTLKVTHRIFRDDLELAIRQSEQKPQLVLDLTRGAEVVEYLAKVTAIEINHKKTAPVFDAFSIEGTGPTSTVQCSFTIDLADTVAQQITISNKLLVDQYDDQVNMVHFISAKGRTSKNLDAQITSCSITNL